MDNRFLIKAEKNSIFSKIANFINKIFGGKKYIRNKEEQKETDFVNSKIQRDGLYRVNIPDEINSNTINESKKKRNLFEIIQIIEKNPETLEKLDVSKLEVIDNYYKEKIIECKKKIENVS